VRITRERGPHRGIEDNEAFGHRQTIERQVGLLQCASLLQHEGEQLATRRINLRRRRRPLVIEEYISMRQGCDTWVKPY
jgi:hypothetical protein